MSKVDVVRAWKDEGYRAGLSAAQRQALPANPAGLVDLSDVEQGAVNGGFLSIVITLFGGCLSGHVTCNKSYCAYLKSLETQSATC